MPSRLIRCLFAVMLIFTFASVSRAVIPTRKFDVNATITKVKLTDDAEQKKGVLATIELEDRDKPIVVTKETNIHQQKGKLVPEAKVSDLKKGQKVSVWLKDKSDKAEAVLIFP